MRSDAAVLAARAAAFNARARGPKLPALWLFTDPARLGDPLAAAARLPRGAGVVFRHFGNTDRAETGAKLAALCRRRGLKLLVGADPMLARRLRADGVHLPERMAGLIKPLNRRRWIVTVAAHSAEALRRAAGADAAFLSPLLPSASPSAGPALGPRKAQRLARAATLPVIGLGGITGARARSLTGVKLIGLAAVEALAPAKSPAAASD